MNHCVVIWAVKYFMVRVKLFILAVLVSLTHPITCMLSSERVEMSHLSFGRCYWCRRAQRSAWEMPDCFV